MPKYSNVLLVLINFLLFHNILLVFKWVYKVSICRCFFYSFKKIKGNKCVRKKNFKLNSVELETVWYRDCSRAFSQKNIVEYSRIIKLELPIYSGVPLISKLLSWWNMRETKMSSLFLRFLFVFSLHAWPCGHVTNGIVGERRKRLPLDRGTAVSE